MRNGTRVQWISHTGKERTGVFIMDFNASSLSMVIGDWDNKVHRIAKNKLNTAKKSLQESKRDES